MSVGKIIGFLFFIGICLFAVMLYLALSPTIRNVSDNVALKKYLHRPLVTKRNAVVVKCESTDYNFTEHVLVESNDTSCKLRYDIPAGSELVIKEFKTYKNANSGFTYLYAIAEVTASTGEKILVEYNWGSTDLQLLAHKPPHLPVGLWQNEEDLRTIFAGN
jgi:hypothetical protein